MRRFEMAAKFWEIDREGAEHTVRFGKLGTAGQTQTKSFASPSEAQRAMEALVLEKTRKGYVEVKRAKAAPAKSKSAPAKAPLKTVPGKSKSAPMKTVPAKSKRAPAKAVADTKAPPAKSKSAPAKAAATKPPKATKAPPLPAAIAAFAAGELVPIGELSVDGALVVGDPVLLPDGEVVKVKLAAGDYETFTIEGTSSRGREVRGLLALRKAASVASVRKASGQFGVDGGLGGMWTKAVEKAWSKLPDDVAWFEDVIDPVMKDARAGVVAFGGTKLVACLSGHGDGVFPVHACLDGKGEVVGVLTVFIAAAPSVEAPSEAPSDEASDEQPGMLFLGERFWFGDELPFVRDAKQRTVLGEIELDGAPWVGDVLVLADGQVAPFGPEEHFAALGLPSSFAGRYTVRLDRSKAGAPLAVVLVRVGAEATRWTRGEGFVSATGVVAFWGARAAKAVRSAKESARVDRLRGLAKEHLGRDLAAVASGEPVVLVRAGAPASKPAVAIGQDERQKHVGIALVLSDRRAEHLLATATKHAARFLG